MGGRAHGLHRCDHRIGCRLRPRKPARPHAESKGGQRAATPRSSRAWRVRLVRVLDYGPGIPPADLAAVLQPYVRLEDSRNRGTGGTGLGLAIASELAKALGGRLVLGPRADGAQGLEARVELPEALPA